MLEHFLDRIGNHLRGAPGLRLEWSLRVCAEGVFDRDRISCWVDADAESAAGFDSVARLLADVGAPSTVLRTQSLRSSSSIVQGVGLARAGEELEWRLYLHHRDPETNAEHYDALRWLAPDDTGDEAVAADHASYHFHFFPETPEGAGPLDFVHPRFSSGLRELLRHDRLRQLSGFSIRRHRDDWDQIDLVFPWHPPLAEVQKEMRALTTELGISSDWIEVYAGHPLRHVAFRAGVQQAPSFTVYFSAPATGSWPRSLGEWKEQVRENGTALHDELERQIFSRLPALPVESNQALGDFYNTTNIEVWRQVLGRGMHYHFGLFEEPWSPAMPEEKIDQAMEKAVTGLFPFLPPRGGSVYDIGCGWGGPADLLLRQRGNHVTGITVSRTQFQYCASLGHSVRRGDVETTLPPRFFDCALLLESLCHVRDKLRLLRVLRTFAKRLVMRVHCQDMAPNSVNFGGTMHMIRSHELRALIEEAGWNVIHWRNRRDESMPTIHAWRRRLQSIAVRDDDVHLETLRFFCDRVSDGAAEWAMCNPLMEVVAD